MSSATQATVTYIDDADPGFVYKGNWQNVNSTLADIGDGVHVSSTNGSSVSYSFNGTFIPTKAKEIQLMALQAPKSRSFA